MNGKTGPSWDLSVVREKTPPRRWVELVLAHEPAHLLGIDHAAAATQLGADATVAVALELVGDAADLGDEAAVRELLRDA